MTPRPSPTLFDRQKRMLALLDVLGGNAGKLDFQKLLFLYCQEVGESAAYEFLPYKFGAFSFTSYADRRKLMDRGLLEEDEQNWVLTPAGRSAVKCTKAVAAQLATFAKKHDKLRGDSLVADTYRQFPYYATRSEIADRLLAGDPAALRRIAAARPARGPAGLTTIGYEGRSLENYLNQLLRSGVTLLCDVRRNPLSRKYGFSKGTLSKGCEGVGIRYEHLPELGIASDKRQHLEEQADYDRLFKDYEKHALPAQLPALETIRGWITAGERVALTCYERAPHQCHRHCVAEAMETKFGVAFAASHL